MTINSACPMDAKPPLRSVLWGDRSRVAATLALMLLTLLAGVALLGISGGFLTAAAIAAGGLAGGFNLFMPSAAIRGLTLIRILSRYGERLVGHDATLRIARDLRGWLYARLLPLAPGRADALRDGAVLTRLLGDVEAADGLLVRAVGPSLAVVLATGATALVAGAFHGPVGVLVAGMAALAGAAAVLPHAGGRAVEARRAGAREALRSEVHEGIVGAGDLQGLGIAEAWHARVGDAAATVSGWDRRRRARLLAAQAGVGVVGGGLLVGALWLVVSPGHAGTLSAPVAVGLVLCALGLAELWSGLVPASQAWLAGRVATARLSEMVQSERGSPATSEVPLPTDPPALRFDNVSFGWAGRDTVLAGFCLAIEPGETLLVQGPSGCGKSTLALLMLGAVAPASGAVTYGGVDLQRTGPDRWHPRVAWLPQAAPVLAGSVRYNLTLGAGGDDADLMEALRRVRLDVMVRDLGGLDAWIGEDGATLSTGQARRLAVARVLLRTKAEVWILDEPTEGVDDGAADALMSEILRAAGSRSVVVISHDEAPQAGFDRVIQLCGQPSPR